MNNLKKSILFATPGEKEIMTIEGRLPAIERFTDYLNTIGDFKDCVTELQLPYGPKLYIFSRKDMMVLARIQWDKEFSNWIEGVDEAKEKG